MGYITFKPSVYKMSHRIIVMFVIILVLIVLIAIPGFVLMFFTEFLVIGYLLVFVSLFLYSIGCGVAVYFFKSNLSALTTLLVTSLKNVNHASDIELCDKQKNLSNLSSKYTMLFGFSIGSTILSVLLMLSVHHHLRGPFIAIDLCINLWCMYLQFGFAEKRYKSCCKWCDERYSNLGLERTKMTILHSSKESIRLSGSNSSKSSKESNDMAMTMKNTFDEKADNVEPVESTLSD